MATRNRTNAALLVLPRRSTFRPGPVSAGESIPSFAALPAPLLVCLPFKRIVAVRPAAHQPEYQAAAQIGRPHEWPPTLELANMNQFVVTANVEGRVGLPQDRVAEGCRRPLRTEPLWPRESAGSTVA